MEALLEMFARGFEQLLGRAGGPLHFRLLCMPTMVTLLATLAGLRDAREGRPAFLWAILTNPVERPRAIRSGLKDLGRVIIMALVLDTTYQLAFLHEFHVVQLLIMVVGCALMPYGLIRGPVTRLTRGLYRKKAPAGGAASKTAQGPQDGSRPMPKDIAPRNEIDR